MNVQLPSAGSASEAHIAKSKEKSIQSISSSASLCSLKIPYILYVKQNFIQNSQSTLQVPLPQASSHHFSALIIPEVAKCSLGISIFNYSLQQLITNVLDRLFI